MKYDSTARSTAAGLVLSVALVAVLGGFTPAATPAAYAATPATTLEQATPAVKIAAVSARPTVRVARKLRTSTEVAPASSQTSSKSARTAAYVSTTGELAKAKSILAGLIAKYPILKGTTVTMGTTPGGYQAVCYYKSGRIIVSPKHTANLTTILTHEVWHVIDWRDNGRIDWGENIPR